MASKKNPPHELNVGGIGLDYLASKMAETTATSSAPRIIPIAKIVGSLMFSPPF